MSRPARGEWIESCTCFACCALRSCLAPQGASGLKVRRLYALPRLIPSRPARGEWIESRTNHHAVLADLSRPARGEWIESFL